MKPISKESKIIEAMKELGQATMASIATKSGLNLIEAQRIVLEMVRTGEVEKIQKAKGGKAEYVLQKSAATSTKAAFTTEELKESDAMTPPVNLTDMPEQALTPIQATLMEVTMLESPEVMAQKAVTIIHGMSDVISEFAAERISIVAQIAALEEANINLAKDRDALKVRVGELESSLREAANTAYKAPVSPEFESFVVFHEGGHSKRQQESHAINIAKSITKRKGIEQKVFGLMLVAHTKPGVEVVQIKEAA